MIPQQLTELGVLLPAMSNFGSSFRKARESSGLPLDKIAAETRISTRFLTAIENEDFHLLPGGVFNRGFIRAYAERVGLDPEQALADYDRISIAVEQPVEELRSVERASMRRTERNLYPIAAGILLLLIAVFYIVTRNGTTGSAAEPAVPAAASQPAPTPAPAAEAAAPDATLIPETAAFTTPPALMPVEPAVTAPSTVVSTPPLPTPPAPAATSAPASAPAPAATTLVLDIDVKGLSWVRITTDGNVVLNDNLQPGSTRRFTAASSIGVSIGNAAGTSLKINGRDLPALGKEGQVRELTITQENAAQIR